MLLFLQKELSLRYLACISILTRPVLYFVLYQDLENSSTTSPGSVFAADRQLEPWVFAYCRDCIECSKVIILTLAQYLQQLRPERTSFSPRTTDHEVLRGNSTCFGPTWCDIQLLVGSYAVLLSVQTASAFSLAFRDIPKIDEILDIAERTLSRVTSSSMSYANTFEMLVNIRQNFQNSTPLTGASY